MGKIMHGDIEYGGSSVAEKVMFDEYAIEFGIDSQGRYGYIKHGESTVTPFGGTVSESPTPGTNGTTITVG